MSAFYQNQIVLGVGAEQCYEPGISVTEATARLQAAVDEAVSKRLPLLLRGQGRVLTINASITFSGSLEIDGGSVGATIIEGLVTTPDGTQTKAFFARANRSVDEPYFACRGVRFQAAAGNTEQHAIAIRGAKVRNVQIEACEFHNCGVIINIDDGTNAWENHTNIRSNRWTSDDLGATYSPFFYRSGVYSQIVPSPQPAEPRADRKYGLFFTDNTLNIFMQTSANVDIATMGYGLSQCCTVTGNIFENRNPDAAAQLDFAVGGEKLMCVGNHFFDVAIVSKGSMPPVGYTYASINEDKVIALNQMKFSDLNVNENAMLLIGAFWIVNGNVIRARKATEATRRFSALCFIALPGPGYPPDYGDYLADRNEPYLGNITGNMIDVRMAVSSSFTVTCLQLPTTDRFKMFNITGNTFMGGNESGLKSSGDYDVIAANQWLFTDDFAASGPLDLVFRAAAANSVRVSDGTLAPSGTVVRAGRELNRFEPTYTYAGTSSVVLFTWGGHAEFDTTLCDVTVNNATAGIVGDEVIIRRTPGTLKKVVVQNSGSFRTPGGATINLDADYKYVRVRKATSTTYVIDGGYW